jgi:hypothetical protein
MVKVKRIKAPSDIPAEGSYVLVLYGPSAIDREHPRGRTLVVRDGKRDKVKLDEFAAAVETASFDCVAHEAPRMSLFWLPSPRTCGDLYC